ncbi:MAG: SDR family NAD(P)-dependent oxidoreductase [Bacillota bacterium]|nr:SDR family NAD(P)-dependent oxidoreductase [Bacillota bacterium]
MKTAVITGASDGIGKEAARALAKSGWQLAIVGRNPDKTAQVAKELGAVPYAMDFASLQNVKALSERLSGDYACIDLLINNAGGIFKRQPPTVDGFEITFQVNHLAPFLLTKLLLPKLIESKAAVITTASIAHCNAGMFFDLDRVEKNGEYSPYMAYGNSKLANILMTRELDRRYRELGVKAACFHPGVVSTSFAKAKGSPMGLMYNTFLRKLFFMKTPQEGADTLIWLAEGEPYQDWQPGGYYANRKPAGISRKAQNQDLALALWEKSEALCAPYL